MSYELLQMVKSIETVKDAEVAVEELAAEMLRAGHRQRIKNLKALQTVVNVTIEKRLLPARDFERVVREIEATWCEVVELLLPYLPDDVRVQVGELTRELFSGIREDMRKR
jgi:hypothetical protein